jgi:hypothetical protein
MEQSTKKQVTGKHGTPEKTSPASGFSPLGSSNSDWLNALQVAQASNLETPGAEWKTKAQLEAIFNVKRSRMGEIINSLQKQNCIERKTFIVMISNALRHIPHYRLK